MPKGKKLTDSQQEQYLSIQNENYSTEDLEIFLVDTKSRLKIIICPIEKEKQLLKDRILVYKLILQEMK